MYNFIFLFYGLLAILTQLVIFRELLVLFYGSELFLGTFLSSWLFWVGLGSLSIQRLLKKKWSITTYLAYGFLLVALFFPVIILLIRASKSVFAFGEFIGPIGTIAYTFSIMSGLCFVIGSQFSLACALAANKVSKEIALGRVYMYEALGAGIGGILFTYIYIGFVPTFIIALGLSLCCIFICLVLSIKNISPRSALVITATLAVLFIVFKFEPIVNKIEWKRYQFIVQKEARNETLSLVKMGSIKNVFVDGILSASFPNPEAYEPIAHWPLLLIAKPDKILIIGETSLGVLKEVLKYNPKQIDYCLLDNSFINLVKPHLESDDITAIQNPAIHTHYTDPRIFIKNTKDKYDAVIINIPEVPNLKTNRFYTKEFYGQVISILSPNGVLALSAVSSENYLSMQTRLFNASVYHTLKSIFKQVEVIPGDTIMFLSSSSPLEVQKETILKQFNERNISNHYFIPSYIEYKLEAGRRAELKRLLDETTSAKINHDFRPTTCYYFSNFWLNKFASPLGYLVVGILLIVFFFSIFKKSEPLSLLTQKKEIILIFILGFIGMLIELILLLGYEIISGFVYWQMGVLFASFMLGLFLGSFLANQLKHILFLSSQVWEKISLVILSLAIIGLSVYMAYLLPHLIYLSIIQNILIFVSLLVIIGAIVGASFVVASFLITRSAMLSPGLQAGEESIASVSIQDKPRSLGRGIQELTGSEIMKSSGSLYAADLWGAALGAILSTNLIVLVFGILGALIFSAIIGLLGLTIFLLVKTNQVN